MTSMLVELHGDFDYSRKAELEQLLLRAELADVAVIDLQDVSYIDSTALSALAKLKNRMMDGGSAGIVRITGAALPLRRVFEICGLDHVFEIA